MISVVIPLFNKASTIERCLNSVNNQIQIPDELIIINDGSQDHSLQIVNAWVKKNTKIYCRIINQPNKGVSYSRNKGVALSRNNFVLLKLLSKFCLLRASIIRITTLNFVSEF